MACVRTSSEERARLRAEAERFDPETPIAGAATPPASWYVDEGIFELERRHLLAHSWQPVARVDQLSDPGAFASGRLFGRPWLVARDADGTLRAFDNVCRHKGHEVARGCGRAEELVCGYHAWTYGLDGRLRRAPRTAGLMRFDRTKLSLHALRLELLGPFVLVNADPDAAPFAPSLAGLEARLAPEGWERLRFVGGREWTIECNWKVYVDNYLDGGYHIPHMHPSLDAQLDMRSYRTECFERVTLQSVASAESSDPELAFDARARIGAGAAYVWIHPNWMLNRYGPWLESNHVVPEGVARTRIVDQFFVDAPEGTLPERELAASMAQSSVTQREDISICESVQVGLASGAYETGCYAPKVEIAEHLFHRLLAADYLRAVDALERASYL